MGRTTKNQLGPYLQKFFFFIVCLGFCFFYQKAKYQKNAQLQNSVVLGAETFAELFFLQLYKNFTYSKF